MKSFFHCLVFTLIWYQTQADCDTEDAENLYKCVSDGTENAFFASVTRPGRPGGGVLNQTRLCDALTSLSKCDTKCKEMAKGIFYTVASQLYVSPKTRDVECAKTFVEKHGKVDKFIEDGSCSIVESKGRGGDFKRFSDCMIAPFEKVKKAEAEKNLCDGLKEISECETVHTACKNEYIGLAHGIANFGTFGDNKGAKCVKEFIAKNTKTLSPGASETKETEKSEDSETTEGSGASESSENTSESSGVSESLWMEIEKLNEKFLKDLKLLLPSA